MDIESLEIYTGNNVSDKIEAPTVNILGEEVALFSFDVGFSLPNGFVVESDYNAVEDELNVIIGLDVYSYSQKKYGVREKPTGEKFRQAYKEIESTVSAIGKNDKVFKRRFNDNKHSFYDNKGTIGSNY